MTRLFAVRRDASPSGTSGRRGVLSHLRLASPLRLVVVVPSLIAGCAGPNQIAQTATVVPFSGLDEGKGVEALTSIREAPVIVHFEKGQIVPLDLVIESRLFDLDLPELELRAKREFFLMLRADGPPLLSEDGVEFEERPRNSFMLGFNVRKGEKTTLHVGLAVRPESPAAPE